MRFAILRYEIKPVLSRIGYETAIRPVTFITGFEFSDTDIWRHFEKKNSRRKFVLLPIMTGKIKATFSVLLPWLIFASLMIFATKVTCEKKMLIQYDQGVTTPWYDHGAPFIRARKSATKQHRTDIILACAYARTMSALRCLVRWLSMRPWFCRSVGRPRSFVNITGSLWQRRPCYAHR